ncbi:serine dehydratase [Actibacterium mucosum KCTC 23349]|uniref:L-serine dehydratase n=1 Tax=Actibacterium mucosum KCTC 23349 TaxID=1454373 RepID=A0A037ZIR7_9RHOB|nr:L-serine ammonia-lyase [Actibacterium mucosum]KAJ54730.1 serine dehydratase [Actibacterium mucosum KCTC 23349]
MFLSTFEIFKIGVGPSSSHTMGPMVAARDFIAALPDHAPGAAAVAGSLHGSLAFTGKGHATDRAVFLGLMGFDPATLDADAAETALVALSEQRSITPQGLRFDPARDLAFDYGPPLPQHANGMQLWVLDADGHELWRQAYFSVGGGFVKTAAEMDVAEEDTPAANAPYPFANATQMLAMGEDARLSIADMKRANELANMSPEDLRDGLHNVWCVMCACIDRGLGAEGTLPGGLNVTRRARGIHARLGQAGNPMPHSANDWLSVYAMAVNEENAMGGQIVTAPTNGAAGVVPAVMRYYDDHCDGFTDARLETFLLTAAAIGGLIKHNASISGAECGCQAEVGSAAAMAAAGFCAVLGGTNAQIENAAEIALEHHLGMTCDPVKGLVQVPCIERNAMGAIKAVSAASLALHGDGGHVMPLDNCIETMRQTGEDMRAKYKETSRGGLAVNLPEC